MDLQKCKKKLYINFTRITSVTFIEGMQEQPLKQETTAEICKGDSDNGDFTHEELSGILPLLSFCPNSVAKLIYFIKNIQKQIKNIFTFQVSTFELDTRFLGQLQWIVI